MQPLPKPGKLLVLALCCLLLLFFSVEVAHMHTAGAWDSGHCQLCLAAHVAVQSTSVLAAALLLSVFARVSAGQRACVSTAVHFVCRIRPPPFVSGLTFALL